jgi:hypothetical protein
VSYIHIYIVRQVIFSVADPDPGSGAFLNPSSRIRDGEKYPDPDPEWTSKIIFLRASTVFRVKILKFFDANPGCKNSNPGQNIPDPHNLVLTWFPNNLGTSFHVSGAVVPTTYSICLLLTNVSNRHSEDSDQGFLSNANPANILYVGLNQNFNSLKCRNPFRSPNGHSR